MSSGSDRCCIKAPRSAGYLFNDIIGWLVQTNKSHEEQMRSAPHLQSLSPTIPQSLTLSEGFEMMKALTSCDNYKAVSVPKYIVAEPFFTLS